MEVLTDRDIERVPIAAFVDAISDFLVADFGGRTTSPPRQSIDFPVGKMVFTTGGSGRLAGFRAYESFDSSGRIAEQQIVAAWDTVTCVLKGICLGTRLGAIRTGVLGGIAVDTLAPSSAAICALIGTGVQAETQLLGILARRQLTEVRVFSRSAAKVDAFLERMRGSTQATMVACGSAEDAVSGTDIAVLATDSKVPVVEPAVLGSAAHITTVGPKFREAHELPLEAATGRLIVSDSPRQIRDQGSRHMLSDRFRQQEPRHLGELLSSGNSGAKPRSLYLSAGLAGTEVVALDAALTHRG